MKPSAAPSAGRQARDVNCQYQVCKKCQQSKLPSPQCPPLVNIPVGCPWQMIADILEVLISSKNNCYLLVIQDYYTKWAEAIPIPDQKEVTITNELIKVLSGLGIPEIYTLIKDVILKALFWLKP